MMPGAAILRGLRLLAVLAACALLPGQQPQHKPRRHGARHAQASPRPRVPAQEEAAKREEPQDAPEPPAAEAPAPVPAAPAPAAVDEPRYSLEVFRQNSHDVIWEFAKRANQPLDILDGGDTRITVMFNNLPFEKALKEILRAANLDYVKNEEGYTVGLQVDLKQRFPNPEDTEIEATYRCRRINAASLVESIRPLFSETDLRVNVGPEFLTPAVESVGGTSDESSIRVLAASDKIFHTHDVVFAGKPDLVNRALSLARKFDRPRKQVRVNIRVMQMTTSASKQLGVSWMQSLGFTANEVPSTTDATDSSSADKQVSGIKLGRFTHSAISLNATLNAMEQAGHSRTIANPTLLVLDGEKSFILSGAKHVLPELDSRDNSGTPIYKTATQKVGLYLQVGVQVGLDDDMVLSIYPQITSITSFNTINKELYPIINTIEEQATVRAVKGDVIVLGGIKKDVTSDSRNAVPFLSKVPILGRLFRNDFTKADAEELVFFLTPEIVEDTERPLEMKFSVAPGAAGPPS